MTDSWSLTAVRSLSLSYQTTNNKSNNMRTRHILF